MLQPLIILLAHFYLEGPKDVFWLVCILLDMIQKVLSRKVCWTGGCTSANAAQDYIGHPCCQGMLLAWIGPAVWQDLQVIFSCSPASHVLLPPACIAHSFPAAGLGTCPCPMLKRFLFALSLSMSTYPFEITLPSGTLAGLPNLVASANYV